MRKEEEEEEKGRERVRWRGGRRRVRSAGGIGDGENGWGGGTNGLKTQLAADTQGQRG